MTDPSTPPRRVALDSNILNALLRAEAQAPHMAALLGGLREVYTLTVCPVIYAELLAGPGDGAEERDCARRRLTVAGWTFQSRAGVASFLHSLDQLVLFFGLWVGLPTPYLEAVCHTDRLAAYKSVVFGALHRIGGTQHTERFNAILRLRLAHLVRKRLSFSRKQANLEMLVWLFIHRYNASLP